MKGGIGLHRKIITFDRYLSLTFDRLLQSTASVRRKLLKTTFAEEPSAHTNSESCARYMTRIVK